MSLYRVLPEGYEFKSFPYHDYEIQFDNDGWWYVVDRGKRISRFPHAEQAMGYIDGRGFEDVRDGVRI